MNYEINISLNGSHFFATAKRSITSEQKLVEVFKILKAKFPEEEGYEVTCYQCEETERPLFIEFKD